LPFGATAVTKEYPPPGCFVERGCKLLKIKDRSHKRRAKRLQEIDRSRVRAGAPRGVEEVPSR
jgi:hypothetical protein